MYVRHTERRKLIFDRENERKRWESTSQSIAAQMALAIGFGMRMTQYIAFDYFSFIYNECIFNKCFHLKCNIKFKFVFVSKDNHFYGLPFFEYIQGFHVIIQIGYGSVFHFYNNITCF